MSAQDVSIVRRTAVETRWDGETLCSTEMIDVQVAVGPWREVRKRPKVPPSSNFKITESQSYIKPESRPLYPQHS